MLNRADRPFIFPAEDYDMPRVTRSLALCAALLLCLAGCPSEPAPPPPPVPQPEPAPEPQPDPHAPAAVLLELDDWTAQDPHWPLNSLLLELSDIAYETDPQAAAARAQPLGFTHFEAVTDTDTRAHLHVYADALVIAFPGTASLRDVRQDLKVGYEKADPGQMHGGFARYFARLQRNGLFERVRALAPRRVWLTGHSLGGALAVVCGYEFDRQGIAFAGIVTFGQPMVGDRPLAQHLHASWTGRHCAVINGEDCVPRLPPWNSPCGATVWMTEDDWFPALSTSQFAERAERPPESAIPPNWEMLPPLDAAESAKAFQTLDAAPDVSVRDGTPLDAAAQVGELGVLEPGDTEIASLLPAWVTDHFLDNYRASIQSFLHRPGEIATFSELESADSPAHEPPPPPKIE